MKRTLLVLLLALVLTLVFAFPAFAHTASPCNDSGEPGNSDYAQHHIVPMAHDGLLGSVHVPGSHMGYSICVNGG